MGSQSGTSERVAESMLEDWTKRKGLKLKLPPKVLTGNDVADKLASESLSSEYDVILVVTSSYGEGDAPDNYDKFFMGLLRAVKEEKKPCAGMQHAVLGFGGSSYDTFQNCPRLTDKMLGECGSRRLHKRAEIDSEAWQEGEPERMEKLEKEWKEQVFSKLQSGVKATDPPACEWAEKGVNDTVYPKSIPGGPPSLLLVAVFMAIVGFGVGYYMTQLA